MAIMVSSRIVNVSTEDRYLMRILPRAPDVLHRQSARDLEAFQNTDAVMQANWLSSQKQNITGFQHGWGTRKGLTHVLPCGVLVTAIRRFFALYSI